jgi:hypothetical protein
MDDKKVAAELLKLAKSLCAEETAKSKHDKLTKEVNKLVEKLRIKLKRDAEAFKKDEKDWGYVGSLERVQSSLEDLNSFLGE